MSGSALFCLWAFLKPTFLHLTFLQPVEAATPVAVAATKPTPTPTPTSTTAASSAATSISEGPSTRPSVAAVLKEYAQLRDPFKMPKHFSPSMRKDVSELQLVPTESLTLLGVMRGLGKDRAVIADDRGKTYTVFEGALIGNRGGSLKKIGKDEIRILERAENIGGELEDSWFVIKLGQKAVAEDSVNEEEER